MRDSSLPESGFTLVEIMIASAILFILAFGVATLLYNQNTQQTRIEDRAKQADLVQGAALDLRLKPIPTTTP